MKRIYIVFFLLAASNKVNAESQPASTRVMGVCELAVRLAKYDNRIVAVRGTFFSGRHGATVGQERCAKPTPFKEFGSGIALNLAFPGEEGPEGPPVREPVDRESLRRFEDAINANKAKGGGDLEVMATFVGLLNVQRGFKLRRTPNGGLAGNGFGHLGRYPAQVVLLEVRDASARTVPSTPKSRP